MRSQDRAAVSISSRYSLTISLRSVFAPLNGLILIRLDIRYLLEEKRYFIRPSAEDWKDGGDGGSGDEGNVGPNKKIKEGYSVQDELVSSLYRWSRFLLRSIALPDERVVFASRMMKRKK